MDATQHASGPPGRWQAGPAPPYEVEGPGLQEGMLAADPFSQFSRWLADGRLRYREDVVEGLEHAPRAFIGMLRGENRGKLLVQVADQ